MKHIEFDFRSEPGPGKVANDNMQGSQPNHTTETMALVLFRMYFFAACFPSTGLDDMSASAGHRRLLQGLCFPSLMLF